MFGLISKKKIRRVLRYLIMFLTVFLSTEYIFGSDIDHSKVFILSTIVTIVFCILDVYYPLM